MWVFVEVFVVNGNLQKYPIIPWNVLYLWSEQMNLCSFFLELLIYSSTLNRALCFSMVSHIAPRSLPSSVTYSLGTLDCFLRCLSLPREHIHTYVCIYRCERRIYLEAPGVSSPSYSGNPSVRISAPSRIILRAALAWVWRHHRKTVHSQLYMYMFIRLYYIYICIYSIDIWTACLPYCEIGYDSRATD